MATTETNDEIIAEIACVEFTSKEYKFDLRTLEKEDDQYFKAGVGWNFCAYLPNSEYFASYSPLDGGQEILTSSEAQPTEASEILGVGKSVAGISLTWSSEEVCANGGTNSFTAVVMCDETVKGLGNGRIDSVDTSDACNPIATVSHESGCPISLEKEDSSGPLIMIILLGLIGIIFFCTIVGLAACVCAGKKKKEKEDKDKEGKKEE